MKDLISNIEKMVPDDLTERLPSEHGVEVRFLCSWWAKFRQKEAAVEDLLFHSKVVMDRTWEMLNIGKWSEVSTHHRQAYAIACLIHVIALLTENKEDAISKSLEITDLGILLGHPFEGILLTKVAELLSSHVAIPNVPIRKFESGEGTSAVKKIKLTNEVGVCSRPSLEFFRVNYFGKEPVKITDCIDHWPALRLWADLEYIKAKAGCRTVPIEIGKHYADSSYSQKLMKVSDFINEFFREDSADVGYLAQHQLFDQVPELRKDIAEPEYCALSERTDSSECETDINAWFGPKGTVSPLHFDPKHNLLCQVVGSKKIILYPESHSEYLYPREGLFKNTSQVDVENPDHETFPNFQKAVENECLLKPGEMLYIPPRYWHHVRALETSFSVSFWWE